MLIITRYRTLTFWDLILKFGHFPVGCAHQRQNVSQIVRACLKIRESK